MALQDDGEALRLRAETAASAGHLEEVSLNRHDPSESVRYYYALFGMATLMCANIGCVAITYLKADASAVGARATVGAINRGRLAVAAFLASWLISLVCLIVAWAFIRFVLGVNLGDQPLPFLLALALGAALATALGGVIGAIHRIPERAKNGIITGISCAGALFAGLYGQPCMELADQVSAALPWLDYVNPANAISDAFFSLYNFNVLGPYWQSMLALLVFFACCLGLLVFLMRRDRLARL